MYDLVGGGFHRYSVDEQWLVPHFEKMLYDNALLVPAYLHAWVLTGEEALPRGRRADGRVRPARARPPRTAASRRRRMPTPNGVEGLTFTWTPGGARRGDRPRPRAAAAAVRARPLDPPRRADTRGAGGAAGGPRAAAAAGARRQGDRLLERAAARRARRGGAAARPAATGSTPPAPSPSSCSGRSPTARRLHRTWRDGVAKGTGYLDDYANVAHGLYELHVATGELRWLERVVRGLALLAVELFGDPERGGFFLTPADGERLVARQKDSRRQPDPVGELDARLRPAAARPDLGRRGARAAARPACSGSCATALLRAPSAFGWALCALDLHLAPPRELAIVGPPSSDVARAALRGLEPNSVVAFGPGDGVPLLAGKTLVGGRPAVYVCERFACRAPVTDAAALPG